MPRRPPPTNRARPPAPAPRPSQPRYEIEADVLEGLEEFAYDELEYRLGQSVRFEASERPGALRFSYAGDLAALLALRSVVAVYLVLEYDIPRPKALLGNVQIGELSRAIEAALDLAPAGSYASLRLSAAGEDSAVLTRLKDQLAQRFGLAVSADEGDLLLRLRRAAGRDGWEVLVRLTPRPLATRAWRVCNFPGSLNATLAHAIAAMTAPAPRDTLLNIACGSGTLLIEWLALSRARQAIGCDTDPAALECARSNLQAAGYADEVRLEEWDAGALPLPDASVDVIVGDLPFGQLISTHRQNEEFYPRALAEAARVARRGARMALLTHEVRLLERTAERYADEWRVREVLRVRSGGMTPRVVLFERTRS
jgi:23S rRNA G2445 N2-methylase RlmL